MLLNQYCGRFFSELNPAKNVIFLPVHLPRTDLTGQLFSAVANIIPIPDMTTEALVAADVLQNLS